MRKRLAVALAVVALIVSATTGMAAPLNTQTSPEQCRDILAQPRGVLFIGDSITAMGFDNITEQFRASDRHVCINGLGGRFTKDGVDLLASYRGVMRPDTQIVMALGTNDVRRPYGFMRSQVERALTIAGGRHVYWVKVYEAATLWGPAFRATCVAGTQVTNRQIVEAARAHGNMSTVDWWGLVVLTHGRLIDSYGVHPTSTGNHYRTVMVLNAMQGR